jgi:hypothetical protein
MSDLGLAGWERLKHGGLLLDARRLARVAERQPEPLTPLYERELRRLANAVLDDGSRAAEFVNFVLERVCRFSSIVGDWKRGSNLDLEWGRRAITGETVKPRQVWRGRNGALLPVFFDEERRLGLGRGRKAASNVVGWLRAGTERLALLTNARQWRLIFAGPDFDAWCEWDVELWLEEGSLSPEVTALRTLLQPPLWEPDEPGAAPPLLQAILDSRKGQADLSSLLGERIREAVELLIQGHGEELKKHCADVAPPEVYRAAVRVVMRMVVALFAESRDLLPRESTNYHRGYGLGGLLEDLDKVASRADQRLARSWTAWPRVLALFRLIHQGSHHPELPVRAYGGELFAPGALASDDGVSRALAVFETACFDHELLPDRDVHRILEKLTRTNVKVRRGRTTTTASTPVDFSDLSSEYIGILYEGLLDYELKNAPRGDPIIFLAVGNQPALPLSRLEGMDERAIASLLEKLKNTSRGDDEDEGAEAEADATPEDTLEEGDGAEVSASPEDEVAEDDESPLEDEVVDERHQTRTRAEEWARRAVEIGGLVPRPRGRRSPEQRLAHEQRIAKKAEELVKRVLLPGEYYLVRWGGTRKGSGTFYTRPGLAVPTVQRTLRPLAYTRAPGAQGGDQAGAAAGDWVPKRPEEILALKVCDPACGSGTFPVAALRFLTEALYSALHHHGRIRADGERAVVRLFDEGGERGAVPEERLGQELIPCRPEDDEFEFRMKAVLRRHVVERCIYGVDLDPLAVELCRLSLWIETMDRTLPFSFLDHKIKCGNSLVGAWLDTFAHYPVMAWKNREGGDKNHSNGVHFEKGARTKALKDFVRSRLVTDLARYLDGKTLYSDDLQERATAAHSDALRTLSRMHAMPVHESVERARVYHEELVGSAAWQSLKEAMDLWSACWFWPPEHLSVAPLPTSMAGPSVETRAVARSVATRKRFFHWEIEFPDVYRAPSSGFDAVVGNPPWENLQPNPEEYFSGRDPLFRTYGRLEKQQRLTELFGANPQLEKDWLDHSSSFNDLSNWVGHSASPSGDPASGAKGSGVSAFRRAGRRRHDDWRTQRALAERHAARPHPFRLQTGRLFTYRLFLEQTLALLRDGGRLGMIVPSGIYSDAWSRPLREAFLGSCRWEWLFGFENRDGIFEIHRSYKFNPVILEKGGSTEAIQTAFMHRDLNDWERGEELATPYSRKQVERFSPKSRSLLEIQSRRDLEILEKIYSNSVLLGDDGPDGWGLVYKLEYMMNTDAHLFPPRPKWEADGYTPDEYSRWLKGKWRPIEDLWTELGIDPKEVQPIDLEAAAEIEGRAAEVQRTNWRLRCAQPPYDSLPVARAEIPAGIMLSRDGSQWIEHASIKDIALPLLVGKMIYLHDWTGQATLDAPHSGPELNPDYLLSVGSFGEDSTSGMRLVFRDISNATNERTFISALVPPLPCGNTLPILDLPEHYPQAKLALVAALCSIPFDWSARLRMTGTHLNWHIVESLPVPPRGHGSSHFVEPTVLLSLTGPQFSADLIRLQSRVPRPSVMARTQAERRRVATMIEAVAASTMGLLAEDLEYILAGCDAAGPAARGQNPKGFWRVDSRRAPELRHTVLTLIAYRDLCDTVEACGGDWERGIEVFLSQNNGEGWVLPETLRLADYGLGVDERARHPQPVASRLGPRFYDWQLAQTAEESWRECHVHARNILGDKGYQELLKEIESGENVDYLKAADPGSLESRRRNGQQGRLLD